MRVGDHVAAGRRATDLPRDLGISSQRIYTWRRPTGGLRATRGAQRPKRRFAAIEMIAAEGCSVLLACRVLTVNESGFYAQQDRPSSARSIL